MELLQIMISVCGFAGVGIWLWLLRESVKAQDKTIEAQSKTIGAQADAIAGFKAMVESMKTLVDSFDAPKMLERIKAHKAIADEEAEIAIRKVQRQLDEQKAKSIQTNVE